MDHAKLSSVKIWDALDKEIMRPKFEAMRRFSLYPSESSVVYHDENGAKVWGACLRKSWFRLMGLEQSDPPSEKSMYTFAFGNYIESFIVDLLKKAGLYFDNSVKFYESKYTISGELDAVARANVDKDTKEYVILEIKSTWGGQLRNGYESGSAKSLFEHYEGLGKKRHLVNGFPRESNLLQLLVYLYIYKDDPNLLGGKLIYLLRDNFNRTEFNVILQEEDGKHRAVVNGTVVKGFYVEDIFDRFNLLKEYVKKAYQEVKEGKQLDDLTMPDREFKLEYTKEDAEELFERGEISKTRYESIVKKNAKIGDYQCSYCSYKTLCYSLKR